MDKTQINETLEEQEVKSEEKEINQQEVNSIKDYLASDSKYSNYSLARKMIVAKCIVNDQLVNKKKSGYNDTIGFSFSQLADFMTEINKTCNELGLIGNFKSDREEATLTIINIDNEEEKEVFYMPMCQVSIPNANELQCIGAAKTYAKRYLYIDAFDICLNDQIDKVQGTYNPKTGEAYENSKQQYMNNNSNNTNLATEKQVKYLKDLFKEIKESKIEENIKQATAACKVLNLNNLKEFESLTKDQAKNLISELKKSMSFQNYVLIIMITILLKAQKPAIVATMPH
ncbi:MAG: ERF family protein [Erysipelotrichaceae bacterium]|nr:ERF family protein [Erysipelotrichaceae bacterium]